MIVDKPAILRCRLSIDRRDSAQENELPISLYAQSPHRRNHGRRVYNTPMEFDAVVVGSGPNGLAAGIEMARAGCSVCVFEARDTVGGGARSAELTLPGFTHDVCSAIHPLALGSPFFRQLPLEKHGLRWIHPDFPLAHPLSGAQAAVLHRSIETTAGEFGQDAEAYKKLFSHLVRNWDDLAVEFLQPMLHWPRHPWLLGRFGLKALHSSSSLIQSRFRSEPARALFAGLAAHSFLPLEQR